MVGAVIVGAGEGKRMGASARKQFVKIAGRPIIAYTLDVFEKTQLVDYVVIVVPKDAIEWVKDEIVGEYGYKKVHTIVYGGETRQESVYYGLKALKPGTTTVLVHDAVRPLISETLIHRVMDAAQQTGAAITAVPAKETVKRVESGEIVGTLDRHVLWLAQTPQCFRLDVIMNAHTRAAGQKIEATDDAALVEAAGVKVAVAVGSYSNLKMTSPEDLPMFEYFLGQEVRSKIDSAVDQGGRGRPPRRRRRGSRRRRPSGENQGQGQGQQGQEGGRPSRRTRIFGRKRAGRGDRGDRGGGGEQGHGQDRPREQRGEARRDHRRDHSGGGQRGQAGSGAQDQSREVKVAQDRDGVRHP
jgi:2-C-methyl-D-erythritol 4-phosphate cytidylyltransferase